MPACVPSPSEVTGKRATVAENVVRARRRTPRAPSEDVVVGRKSAHNVQATQLGDTTRATSETDRRRRQ